MARAWLGVSAGLAGLFGCAPLTDYEEVVDRLPPENLVEIDGQRVHVERWGDEGRPLLLIHGFGSSTYGFGELGPLLGRDRRVVAVDLNGFGFTERPEAAGAYSLGGQVELLRGVMERLDLREADVVGHSYGGYLAMRLARDHPARVRRVVLVSPALNMDVAPSGFIRSGLLRRAVYPGLRVLVSSRERVGRLLERAYHRKEILDDDRVWEYQRRLLIEGLDRAYHGFGESLETLGDERVGLDEIEGPVLVVAGRHDEVVPLESLRTALRDAPDRVRLEVVEDSGHSVPEEQPERLARLVSGFLGEP